MSTGSSPAAPAYGPGSAIWYALLTGLSGIVARILTRVEVVGADRVPAEGGIILAANHLHLFDPPLVASACPRRVHPMAKRELFETPLVGWALRPYGAFPVRRFSADMGALRAARNLLREGRAVLMFPEGTRSKDARLHPALPGAAMVALLAGAPVVPVAVTGTEAIQMPGIFFGWLLGRRPRLRVEFGEPFTFGPGTDARRAEQCTDEMMRRIASMLPEPYRGAYGAGSEGTVVVSRQEQPED